MTLLRYFSRFLVAFLLCQGSANAVLPSISASYDHTCVLTALGEVRCWGRWFPSAGFPAGSVADGDVATMPLGGPAIAVAADDARGCAAMADGAVKCWSWYAGGVVVSVPDSVAGLGAPATAVAVNVGSVCVVLSGGMVKCWGSNAKGQLGDGTLIDRTTPVTVAGLTGPAREVRLSGWVGCALLESGAVECWGEGANVDKSLGPRIVVPASQSARSLSGNTSQVCATLVSGGVSCLDGTSGSLSVVPGISSAAVFARTTLSTDCALDVYGAVACGGNNQQGQTGTGGSNTGEEPMTAVPSLSAGVVDLDAGFDYFCALMNGGGVRCWGDNRVGQLGVGPEQSSMLIPAQVAGSSSPPVALTMGEWMACATDGAGATRCWGRNDTGQLADGTRTNRWTPTLTALSGVNVAGVALFGAHSCAVTTGGQVQCWGLNVGGSLGPGAASGVTLPPRAVAGLPTAAADAVKVGGSSACAVIQGEVWCWGTNGYGELGRPTGVSSGSPPDRVSGLPGAVTQLSVSYSHACAVSAGAAYCWGRGSSGALGNGMTSDRDVATLVSGLSSGVKSVHASLNHTCAVLTGGGVKCWGYNGLGQLGDGTTTDSSVPVSVSLSGAAVDVMAVGHVASCAIFTTGEMKCWGSFPGGVGNVYDYEIVPTPTPVIGHEAGVQAVAMGAASMCTSKSDGVVRCWGDNTFGQLGIGSASYRPSPSRFVSSVNVWGQAELVIEPALSYVGGSVTLRAKIPGPNPPGNVRFERNGQAINGCDAAAVSQGIAICTIVVTAAGTATYSAGYDGDLAYPPALVLATHRSSGAAQTTLTGIALPLLISRGTFSVGRPTFVGGAGIPTGTVRFSFAGQECLMDLSLAAPACAFVAWPSGLDQTMVATYSGDTAFRSTASEFPVSVVAALDVNGDGRVDGTDLLWISRFITGWRGSSLAAALSSASARRNAEETEAFVRNNLALFDLDFDGRQTLTTDMLMLSRYLRGVGDDHLIDGALAPFAFRSNASAIRAYLDFYSH